MDTPSKEIERLTFRRHQLFKEAEEVDARIRMLQQSRTTPDKCAEEEPQDTKASTRIADEVRSEHQAGKAVRKPQITIQRKQELFKVAIGVVAQIVMQTKDREEADLTLGLANMLMM